VRILRTAAGRRALQVGLLVGGLFVLGFLCGEQAHAAERTQPASSEVAPPGPVGGVRSLTGHVIDTVGALTHIPTAPAAQPGAPATGAKPGHAPDTSYESQHTSQHTSRPTPHHKPHHELRPEPHAPATSDPHLDPVPDPDPAPDPDTVADPVPDPASVPASGAKPRPAPSRHPLSDSLAGLGAGDRVADPAAGRLVRTVGDRVLQPVGGLVETVTAGLGRATAQMPPLSALPTLPNLPVLPGSPTVPLLPGLPEVPGHTLPAPVTQTPQPASAGPAAEAVVDDRRSGSGAGGAAFGPRTAPHVTRAEADATPVQPRGQRVAGAGHAPAHQAPDSDPTGELLSHAAVDNGTSRHSDAHAVTLNHRAPVRLVPGAAARVDAAGTRDRYRDIPVFPG
jgi:hypothetical protein